jgi:hypothetical protein
LKPELHPNAAKNFDEKARVLLAAVAPEPRRGPSKPPTHMMRPGAPTAHEYTEKDFVDFKITGQNDQLGNTIARYFEHEGRRFGLEDEKYKELTRLSEGIQRTEAFRDVVSNRWVEDTILDWMQAKFAGTTVPELADFLAERCEADVKEHEMWFPVANLSMESDLPFGKVVFKTITKEMMDRLEEDLQEAKKQGLAAGQGEEYAAQMDYYAHRKRQDLQGLAASTVTVNAEAKRAFEVALRESERAVTALSVYHVAATTIPEVTSYCALLGRQNDEKTVHLEVEEGRIISQSSQGYGGRVLNFHLSDEDVSKNRRSFGFDNVSELLALERRSKFQDALLDAILLYSRSTREKDLAGRLVYMLVSMESMLLRNDTEPIQQNVGERMAFLITKDVEKRKAVIRNLKAAYSLRSKFVHHGHTIADLETVKNFMLDTWVFFLELAKNSREFGTKDHFIDHLEAMKLS